MKSLVLSAVLLVFSASYAQNTQTEEQIHTLKMNTTCGACVAKVNKAVCEKFKSSLSQCTPEVGSLTLKGKNIDMAAIKKAIAKTGYVIQSEENQDEHSGH